MALLFFMYKQDFSSFGDSPGTQNSAIGYIKPKSSLNNFKKQFCDILKKDFSYHCYLLIGLVKHMLLFSYSFVVDAHSIL